VRESERGIARTGPRRKAGTLFSPGRLIAAAGVLLAGLASLSACAADAKSDPPTAMVLSSPSLPPCEAPRGHGEDYQVGPGKKFASLDKVPWESLDAGDTVRIFYRPEPYKGKFSINAHGSSAAPVRVCGVKGPHGERPIIDGDGAPTRAGMSYGRDSAAPINQARGIVMIVSTARQEGRTQPEHIVIDGLHFEHAQPEYSFTDMAGNRHAYDEFGACIWIERGHHITIADNEITDCSHAVLSRSVSASDGGSDATLTRDIRLIGNTMSGNGATSYRFRQTVHTTYIQSFGVLYEFNHYGALRPGAGGNSIKDRSAGVVIRYNRIEEGAHAIDLVEAEDTPAEAKADPAYRETWVYGNQIVKNGGTGTVIHYGGDHPGSEASYRKGTLYFFHNTVHVTGEDAAGLFQLSTIDEKAEIWNNVFLFDSGMRYMRMRASQDTAGGIESGGILHFGRNWINSGWVDTDKYHHVGGRLEGVDELVTSWWKAPLDDKLVPIAGGPAAGAGVAGPAPASAHPVSFQLDAELRPAVRSRYGAGADLGAIEH
jgi:hypothetical protein